MIRIEDIEYYVIFQFNTYTKEESVSEYYPRASIRRKLRITEDQPEFVSEAVKIWKHRKLCGVLNFHELEEFIWDTCLYYEEIETMGSLTEFGHLDSMLFDDKERDCKAYVSPLIYKSEIEKMSETRKNDLWENLKSEMQKRWGIEK